MVNAYVYMIIVVRQTGYLKWIYSYIFQSIYL